MSLKTGCQINLSSEIFHYFISPEEIKDQSSKTPNCVGPSHEEEQLLLAAGEGALVPGMASLGLPHQPPPPRHQQLGQHRHILPHREQVWEYWTAVLIFKDKE